MGGFHWVEDWAADVAGLLFGALLAGRPRFFADGAEVEVDGVVEVATFLRFRTGAAARVGASVFGSPAPSIDVTLSDPSSNKPVLCQSRPLVTTPHSCLPASIASDLRFKAMLVAQCHSCTSVHKQQS